MSPPLNKVQTLGNEVVGVIYNRVDINNMMNYICNCLYEKFSLR